MVANFLDTRKSQSWDKWHFSIPGHLDGHSLIRPPYPKSYRGVQMSFVFAAVRQLCHSEFCVTVQKSLSVSGVDSIVASVVYYAIPPTPGLRKKGVWRDISGQDETLTDRFSVSQLAALPTNLIVAVLRSTKTHSRALAMRSNSTAVRTHIRPSTGALITPCLLYTSDAADE